MQQYDLLALKSFVAVVDAGSFSKAATQLDASTAAVSRRISGLEESLGIQLFRRTTRRIDLTEAGHQFYNDVVNIFLLLGEAEERITQGRERVSGLMKVAAPMSFGIQELSPLIPRFLKRHSDLRIQLLLEDRHTDLIGEGIDVAVRIGKLSDSTLIARHISSVPRVFCAAPAYLAAHGEPQTPADLAHHHCLQYSQRGSREDWNSLFGIPNEAFEINGSLTANNADVLKEAAVQGLGIALLPLFVVRDAIADGRLRSVLKDYSPPAFGLYAVRPSSRLIPARVRHFIDFLAEAFGSDPA